MIYKKYGLTLDKHKTKAIVDVHTMHTHDKYEMFFLLSGQRRYFVGNSIYDITPGNVIFIPRSTLHRTVSLGKKGYERYVIHFPQEFYEDFVSKTGWDCFEEWSNGVCFQLPPEVVLTVQKAFAEIENEMQQETPWSQASVYSNLYSIVLNCFKNGRPKECCDEETANKIQYICKYISENYREEITLNEAAEMVHIEKTYFCKCFKKNTGTNFLEFLTQTRLNVAKELLNTTDISVGEISDVCGFSGANYFGDVFRRFYGISPTEYRKSQKTNT